MAEAFASYRKAGPDAMFEVGVDLMLEGAKARLEADNKSRAKPRR
ncbi:MULTISPECIES: hypothetical protein [unclassified Variovorax]